MKDDRLYLHHMRERCERVLEFTGPGKSAFLESALVQDAVVRNIEVIGEAAKRVSDSTRRELPELDWKRICGMRDVLIHDYVGVDLEQVWNVAANRIPELHSVITRYLDAG